MNLTKKNLVLLVVILLLIIGSWVGMRFWYFLNVPLVLPGQPPVTFLFAPGSSIKKIAATLKQQHLIKSSTFFVLFVRLSGAEYNLKAGEYVIEPGITLQRLVQKMINGEALHHAFTIVEGWTFSQVMMALNHNPYIIHTIKELSVSEIMAKIEHPGELPEGRFAPDTYLFSGKVTDIEILRKAYNLMTKRLRGSWQRRDQEVIYHCPYEALIVASLIEKETAIEQEKPLIAGVIVRRLQKGMLLQIDPTVIYGLGNKFSGKLTKADLLKSTPYNTYLHPGLPPTPISMPGKSSIEAALHPAAGTSWYYVSKGDGTHKFSESLQEQNKAIKKYLLHK